MLVPLELLKDNITGNENIGIYVEMAVRYRAPWAWFVTQARPSALHRPLVSNRNIMAAPQVVLNVLMATFLKKLKIGKLSLIMFFI